MSLLLLFFSFFNFYKLPAIDLTSPNGKVSAGIGVVTNGQPNGTPGKIYLHVSYGKQPGRLLLFDTIPLGLKTSLEDFQDSLLFLGATEPRTITENYTTLHGKRSRRSNEGREVTYHFENSHHRLLNIIVRAYDDGLVFRYNLLEKTSKPEAILDETTAFPVEAGTERWTQPFTKPYEGFYDYSTDGRGMKGRQEWGFPALFNFKKQSAWALLTEADLSRYNAATHLDNSTSLTKYKVKLPYTAKEVVDSQRSFVGPWYSQWRVMVIGSLPEIVASTLVEDVCLSNQITNTAFVRPGAVSWNYWAYNHGTKDYKIVCDYIDLAVEMHWAYTLLDWEWDQMQNGGKLEDAIAYARKKGIKPLMWYNSGKSGNSTPVGRLNTHESRVKEFEWLNKIGIYGIKVDFFEGDKQHTIAYYLDILKDAADYHLMVDFHGATLPKGWSRTYPNLMTTEAVYGAEWYNNNGVMTEKGASHNTVLPFTRNVVGGMDYTPVTFTNSQHDHTTTYAHELALSVMFESGLQHFADRPSGYLSLPPVVKQFLQEVPVAWDDVQLINGYPGRDVVLARRKGNRWYASGLNGTDSTRELTLSFPFLKPGNHYLTLIADGEKPNAFKIQQRVKITSKTSLKIPCLRRGGFAAKIE